MLRKFHVAPPAEPDPDDIKPVDLHYRCIVCGAEVTMTAAQDDPEAPRHCREDMVLVPELRVIPRLWTNLCEVTGLGFGHLPELANAERQRKNVDSTNPATSSTSPMSRKLLLTSPPGSSSR